MASTLPFRAEYAKSGRAGCKGCKQPIPMGALRLAVMVQSPFFDGMSPNWHHESCFFGRARPRDVSQIAHFQALRWEDQEKIKDKIKEATGLAPMVVVKGKGKKRAAVAGGPTDLKDYIVEYAKSSRSKCKVCEEFIGKKELRISKKDYEGEVAMQYGPTERWHHVDCFIKAREELGFFASASVLPGFMTLDPEDQKELKQKVPKIEAKGKEETDGPTPVKKSKPARTQDRLLREQNEAIYQYRDALEQLKKKELILLLEHNKQEVPEGASRMLDRLSDCMTFGVPKNCEACKGQVVFRSGQGYQCLGHVSEWAKCEKVYLEPKRVNFKVPKPLADAHPFLASYKPAVGKRLIEVTVPAGPEPGMGLKKLEVVVHKVKTKTKAEVTKAVELLGGAVGKSIQGSTAFVISTEGALSGELTRMLANAKRDGVSVVPDEILDHITPTTTRDKLIELIEGKKISEWESKAAERIPMDVCDGPKPSKSVYPTKSKELFKSKAGSVQKVTLKGGLHVDPESQLGDVAHVYKKSEDVYSVVLSLADVQTGRNSYYKMQILEADKGNRYWLFRAWGRVGTTIGGTTCERYSTVQECLSFFKEKFEESTGNTWDNRRNFKKLPGKMLMLDVTYQEDKVPQALTAADSAKSKLPEAVKELVALIFDVERMKKTMMEFDLDLNKMPLGKISQKQIQEAFTVLTELQNLNLENADKLLLTERSNKFYTLVPHDVGLNAPPLLNSDQLIKQKVDMLNSMVDIEIAYKMLSSGSSGEGSLIDSHYDKLNTKISVLDRNSDEFGFIQLYVKNTHAKTHSNYSLSVEQVFKIERKGESSRFKKFKKLPNRMLLWHGSRVTNFAGILSQGLRIAPPEAPVTGYMFGKGIYFADMVSKSANYCATHMSNRTGLMLLCEVALGQMEELTQAKDVKKPPPGKHSVKGLGKTHPDPDEVVVTPSGATVPLGKAVGAPVNMGSSLLYNEFIVYDVAQVKMEYLLRLNFNYQV